MTYPYFPWLSPADASTLKRLRDVSLAEPRYAPLGPGPATERLYAWIASARAYGYTTPALARGLNVSKQRVCQMAALAGWDVEAPDISGWDDPYTDIRAVAVRQREELLARCEQLADDQRAVSGLAWGISALDHVLRACDGETGPALDVPGDVSAAEQDGLFGS